MASRLKLLELLTTDELDELAAFARERSRTVDELHEWVQAHGYTCHRSAVYSWRVKFDAEQMAERVSRSGELARAIRGAVDKGSLEDVAEVAAMQLTQKIFEASAEVQGEGLDTSLEVQRWARSLRTLVGTKADILKSAAAKFEQEMKAVVAKAPDGRISPEALAQASKAIFGT